MFSSSSPSAGGRMMGTPGRGAGGVKEEEADDEKPWKNCPVSWPENVAVDVKPR